MKKTVFFRSTVRQPVRSLFILLLVGVITFAFATRVGEYLLISQEQEQLTQYYRSIGYLNRSGQDAYGYNWTEIPDEVIAYLEQSPYVAYIDQRQYTSGVIDGVYNNVAVPSYSLFLKFGYAAEVNADDVFFYGTYNGSIGGGQYMFTVDEVLSGLPEYVSQGKNIYLCIDTETFDGEYPQLTGGKRYLLRGCADSWQHGYILTFTWKWLSSDLPWFLPAESDIDLSLPEYAQFVSEMRQSHDNACSVAVTATADMTDIPRIQLQPNETDANGYHYYLADGRWLNYEDNLAGNRVVVIYAGLANARGLSIGDTITITLRNLFDSDRNGSNYYRSFGYQTELYPVGQEEAVPTQTETFEIVGIYDESITGTDNGRDPIYIPLSVFPASFASAVTGDDPDVCSIVLTSSEYEEVFQETALADLAAMGYTITFAETNYDNFKNATDGIGTAAQSNAVIFAVILAVCFLLACFVYFRFRRRDLAISRALGVPVGTCVTASALPLVLMGCVGIVGGSMLAWNYAQTNADSLLSALVEAAEGEAAAVTLSMTTLAVLDLILIAVLLVLALIFALVTARRPVLSQLQGGKNKK